jgi:hypothetical protein
MIAVISYFVYRRGSIRWRVFTNNESYESRAYCALAHHHYRVLQHASLPLPVKLVLVANQQTPQAAKLVKTGFSGSTNFLNKKNSGRISLDLA